MFYHAKKLQYFRPPEKPDAVYANKIQELIGGTFGEMTVMMQYLFQGWNCRGPAKYRDLLLDTGTEEIGHIEMLATMIAHLLDKAPIKVQEEGVRDAVVGAVMGGTNPRDVIMNAAMNPQHAIVSGLGALPADSVGFPWNGRFIVSSGNLLADFRSNLHAEGRWAKGSSMDGKGKFEYVANPQPLGPEPQPPQPDPQLHGTQQIPHPQQGNGSSAPPLVERIG